MFQWEIKEWFHKRRWGSGWSSTILPGKEPKVHFKYKLLCLLGILSICLSVWFCVCMLHSLFSYKNLEPNRAEYKFSNITTSLYSRANFWLVSGLISCSDCFLLAWLLSGWVTALVSLSISLMYGSCQDGFSFCMIIFLYLALARLISPHFPHYVWFLLGSFLLCLVRLFSGWCKSHAWFKWEAVFRLLPGQTFSFWFFQRLSVSQPTSLQGFKQSLLSHKVYCMSEKKIDVKVLHRNLCTSS